MKNEILARAITEIDDELLTEAREPVRRKAPNFRAMTKYIGACIAVVLSLTLFGNHGMGDFDMSVDGQNISGEMTAISLSPLSGHSQDQSPREKKVITVPIKIEADGKTVITASEGGTLCTADGRITSSIKTRKDTSFEWIVDVSGKENFELTVTSKSKTLIIKATYDGERECLILSAEEGKN